jgi:hypothetical protein
MHVKFDIYISIQVQTVSYTFINYMKLITSNHRILSKFYATQLIFYNVRWSVEILLNLNFFFMIIDFAFYLIILQKIFYIILKNYILISFISI